ncbi:MAG: hypothetical protein WBB85_09665 [Albidovulum sp.]|uniref:hypothetical protein n=1 Tax=Albidovulum sp. TaxID=1872424 RepID=UPI003CBCE5AD
MPVFSYSARRLTGQIVNGEATAPSLHELGRILAGEGLVLVQARVPGGWLPTLGSFRGARRVGSFPAECRIVR